MRLLLLTIALAIPAAAAAQGQESFSDMRSTSPPHVNRIATHATAAAYQMTDEAPRQSTDTAAIVKALERLGGKFDRLQRQVDNRATHGGVQQAGSCDDQAEMFDGRGRQILYDALGRQVQQRGDGGQRYATVIDQFCPGCETSHTQSHNFTSRSSLSPTTFGNIPMIDSNNNMANAIARVIMVEGRPQLILDPEPIGWIGRLCPWTRR